MFMLKHNGQKWWIQVSQVLSLLCPIVVFMCRHNSIISVLSLPENYTGNKTIAHINVIVYAVYQTPGPPDDTQWSKNSEKYISKEQNLTAVSTRV